nr:ATP phosphoribosyltransferase regulatory subunit [uncultured Desulfuromonas sp.]
MKPTVPIEAMIPKGVKDFLPLNAVKIEHLKSCLHDVFKQWGFQPITPPSLEFLDVLEQGLGNDLKETTLRFDDRQSGKLLAFPPDITPQVARIFATRLKEAPLPQRLCYSCRVLRHTEEQAGKDREIFQSGVELIGQEGPQADAEMIAIALECFERLSASEYTIDIGQVEFYRGALSALDLEPQRLIQVQQDILRKDSSGLKQHLETLAISDAQKEEILALPRLFGNREILDQAAAVVTNDRSKRALDDLHSVLKTLEIYDVDHRITVDLGELRGLDYYTGITFQGFLSGYGQAVCLGGRYDNLTAGYGMRAPATGFAFNLLNLLFSMSDQLSQQVKPATDILIYCADNDAAPAHQLARKLRKQGFSVSIEASRSKEEAQMYAVKMNFTYLMTVTATSAQVEVNKLGNDQQSFISLDSLASGQIKL